MLKEHGLDLTEFDAKAADLHLPVDAAKILDVPVGQEAGQIAGAIEPVAPDERRWHKALGSEFLTVQIALCDARAADKHLARHTPMGHGFMSRSST